MGCWREGRDFGHPPPVCTPPSFLTPALAPLLGQSPSELCPHSLRSDSQDTCGDGTAQHPVASGRWPAAKGAEGANSWGRPVVRGAGGDDWSPGLSKLRVARFADICKRPSWDTLVRGGSPRSPRPGGRAPHSNVNTQDGAVKLCPLFPAPARLPGFTPRPSSSSRCRGHTEGASPGPEVLPASLPPLLWEETPAVAVPQPRGPLGGGGRVPGRCSLSHHPQQKQVWRLIVSDGDFSTPSGRWGGGCREGLTPSESLRGCGLGSRDSPGPGQQ